MKVKLREQKAFKSLKYSNLGLEEALVSPLEDRRDLKEMINITVL